MTQGAVARPVVEGLLAALRAMGRTTAADVFEQEFASRTWNLHVADQLRLLQALQPDEQIRSLPDSQLSVAPGPPPVAPLHPPAATPLTPPEVWPSAVRHHEPFLRVIRDGRALFDAVGTLARSRGWDEVGKATLRLFVDVLGFERDEVDLLPRMTGRSTIGRFSVLARHGDFLVALVQITDGLSDTRWAVTSAHYAACFKLAPHALLVAIEPTTGTLRLVYQQTRRGEASRPRYRALVGPWILRDPHDDLLVWTRRFDLLRPRFGEGHLDLRVRTEEVLDAHARELSGDWPSAPFSTDAPPPGLAFGPTSVVAQIASFLQESVSPSERHVWGLEAALRQVFPTPLTWRETRLACDGYSIDAQHVSPGECWKRGITLDVTVRLRLRLIGWRGEVLPGTDFELAASLPVPDESGRFLVDGQPRVHRPRFDLHGHFVPETVEPAAEDVEDVEDVDAEVDDGQPEDEATPVEEDHRGLPAGAALDVVFQRGVEQRLGQHLKALRSALRRLDPPDPRAADIGRYVRAALVLRTDDRGRLPLLAKTLLRRALVPAECDAPVMGEAHCDGVPEQPPAWACPERSSALDARWVAVSGARVHPCGVLSLPCATDGEVRLRVPIGSALDHNPRCGGTGPGPRSWWIASGLEAWAEQPQGLSRPEDLTAAVPLPAMTVVRSAALSEGTAWVRPAVRPRDARRIRIAVDIAVRPGTEGVPQLLLAEGAWAAGGAAWVVIPWGLVPWHRPPERPLLDEVLARVAPEGTFPQPALGFEHQLPPGAFQVIGVGLENTHLPLGAPSGWRAWIELVRQPTVPSAVVDASGRWYRLITTPDDIPWDGETGDDPDVVLGAAENEVEPDLPWFSGADGEVSATVPISAGVFWLTAQAHTLEPEPTTRQLVTASRVVDRGMPRCDYREWAAIDPVALAAAVRAFPSPLGHAISLVQCARALLAAAAPIPRGAFPPAWTGSSRARQVERVNMVDHVASQGAAARFRPQARWRAGGFGTLIEASCACGERTGERWLGAPCSSCGEAVRERAGAVDPLPGLALPWPVVHPWRKDLAGAVLGLTERELDEVLIAWGPVHLRSAIQEALEEPMSAGLRRLQAGDTARLESRDRRMLGLALQRLERRLAVEPALEGLWLTTLPVPAPELMPAGLVLGDAGVGGAPLAAAFQGIRRAMMVARELAREDSPIVRRAAHVAMQKAVDDLLGSTSCRPEWDSVAGILAATWPWAAPGSAKVSFPGLVHLGGEPIDPSEDGRDDLHRAWSRHLPEEVPPSGEPGELTWEPRPVPEQMVRRESVERLTRASAGRHQVWCNLLARRAARDAAEAPDLRRGSVELPDLLSVMSDWELKWAHQVLTSHRPALETRSELLAAVLEVGSSRVEWVPRDPVCAVPAGVPGQGDARGAELWIRASTATSTTLAVHLPDTWVFPPPPAAPGPWPVARARAVLRRRWWPWLAAVTEHVSRLLPPVEGTAPGDLALAGLATALRDGRAGLTALCELSESGRGVPLPADPAEARSAVRKHLTGLEDGSVAARALVDLLTEAWAGWCLGDHTQERLVGAVWSPSTVPPPGTRRFLVGADHLAWLTWPGVVFVSRPALFADDADMIDWTPRDALRRWVGLPCDAAPGLAWSLVAGRPSEPPERIEEPDASSETAEGGSAPSTVDPGPTADPVSASDRAVVEVAVQLEDAPVAGESTGDIQWTSDSVASWVRQQIEREKP